MRDFDKQRAERPSPDRTFVLGGQEFHFRAGVEPETTAAYSDWASMPLAEEVLTVEAGLQRAGLIGTNGSGDQKFRNCWEKIAGTFEQVALDGLDQRAVVKMLDETIEAFLVPEDRDAWKALRRPGALEQPINQLDMIELISYMLEATSGRPTERSSDSGRGAETTGTTSTHESPQPVEAS